MSITEQKMSTTKQKISYSRPNSFWYRRATKNRVGSFVQNISITILFKRCENLFKREPERALCDAVSILPYTRSEKGRQDATLMLILSLAEKVGDKNPSLAREALQETIGVCSPPRRLRNERSQLMETLETRSSAQPA